jgi:hypothetical protein
MPGVDPVITTGADHNPILFSGIPPRDATPAFETVLPGFDFVAGLRELGKSGVIVIPVRGD